MPLILTDDDVHQFLSPAEAVAVMESVFRARANGDTSGAPRWEMPFPEGRMTFTAGAVPQGIGFRVYVRGTFDHDDQVVVVWDRQTAALKGIITGGALGALRTGAIGGTAIKHMTPPEATSLALIGTGRQAWTQLQAIMAVRPLAEVRVHSRTPEHRAAFCEKAQAQWPDLKIAPVDDVETAVRDAALVVSATTSKHPLILGEWLAPDAHVSTLGTRGRSNREIDEEVVRRAGWIVTDSPEQMRSYPDGTILQDTGILLHELADVVAGKIERPQRGGISLFVSTGLAGTEVALAARLLELVASA
ncbi:MAG: ornithine cyclodeaminase family protein [Anaerolineae bacterium]|nr:ornithine cyclodeaminase family protein [Anaerolineae bacterium]